MLPLKQIIANALLSLDPERDEHWTADGLPRMDAVTELVGDRDITRKMVTDAIPGLTRDAAAEAADDEGEDEEEYEEEEGEGNGEYDPATEEPEGTEGPEDSMADPDEVDALSMPIGDVVSHPALTELALQQLTAKANGLEREKTAVGEALRQVYAKIEYMSRVKVQHDRRSRATGEKVNDIQAYLKTQGKVRADRAARMKRFIDAGVTPEEVAATLRGKSPIDVALGHRRPSPSSQRPAPRAPSQA